METSNFKNITNSIDEFQCIIGFMVELIDKIQFEFKFTELHSNALINIFQNLSLQDTLHLALTSKQNYQLFNSRELTFVILNKYCNKQILTCLYTILVLRPEQIDIFKRFLTVYIKWIIQLIKNVKKVVKVDNIPRSDLINLLEKCEYNHIIVENFPEFIPKNQLLKTVLDNCCIMRSLNYKCNYISGEIDIQIDLLSTTSILTGFMQSFYYKQNNCTFILSLLKHIFNNGAYTMNIEYSIYHYILFDDLTTFIKLFELGKHNFNHLLELAVMHKAKKITEFLIGVFNKSKKNNRRMNVITLKLNNNI